MTLAKPIEVALVTHRGGAHVGAYLSALAAARNCKSVVLLDPDGQHEANAKRVLKDKLVAVERGIVNGLRKRKPEMALVTMEAKLAPPIVRQSLELGCHVFAEKPACVDHGDFRELVVVAKQNKRHLMLALANRTNPEIQTAKKLIEKGSIGKLYGVELHLIADQTRLKSKSYQQQWFAQKARAGGGHLVWLGIHWLDLAMYLTNSTITKCSGFTANVGGQPIDVEDSAVSSLHFDNGTLGTITSGYYLDKGYHSHIKIWGSKGWIWIEPTNPKSLRWYLTEGDKAGQVVEFEGEREPRGYSPFVAAAVDSISGATTPPISTEHSLRAIETVHGIYQSAESGRTVALPLS